jgi:hypothetical protein
MQQRCRRWLLLRSLPADLLCQCALAHWILLPIQKSGQFDLLGLVWDGGGLPLGHGWSRAAHVGAARPRSRRSRAQSRRCRSGHGRPWPYRSPMSLTDRLPARSEGNRSVGLGSPCPLEPLVASAASLPTCPRRDPEVTSSGHGRHGAWPAARAPAARHAGIASAWKARLRRRRAIALGHCSPGPLEPLVAAPLRC